MMGSLSEGRGPDGVVDMEYAPCWAEETAHGVEEAFEEGRMPDHVAGNSTHLTGSPSWMDVL